MIYETSGFEATKGLLHDGWRQTSAAGKIDDRRPVVDLEKDGCLLRVNDWSWHASPVSHYRVLTISSTIS